MGPAIGFAQVTGMLRNFHDRSTLAQPLVSARPWASRPWSPACSCRRSDDLLANQPVDRPSVSPLPIAGTQQIAYPAPLTSLHPATEAVPARPVVNEISGLADAATQRLPDQDRSTTAATLPAASRLNLWTLPVHRGTTEVRIDVRVPIWADPRVQAVLVVMDQERNIVGQAPLPQPGASLSLFVRPRGAASGFILGIMRLEAIARRGPVRGARRRSRS